MHDEYYYPSFARGKLKFHKVKSLRGAFLLAAYARKWSKKMQPYKFLYTNTKNNPNTPYLHILANCFITDVWCVFYLTYLTLVQNGMDVRLSCILIKMRISVRQNSLSLFGAKMLFISLYLGVFHQSIFFLIPRWTVRHNLSYLI